MDQVFIDIRKENEDIRDLFSNKDMVSIDSIFNAIADLQYQINELNEVIYRLEHPEDDEPSFMEKWKIAKENGWI